LSLIGVAVQSQEDGVRRFNGVLYSHCQDIAPLLGPPQRNEIVEFGNLPVARYRVPTWYLQW